MKRFSFSILLFAAAVLFASAQSKVYFTKDITASSLVKIYKAVGKPLTGKVAVKISTGESSKTNYLRPTFIRALVDTVNGTIVECNTAYPGNRNSTAAHRKAIHERGFDSIAVVDIMDEEGEIQIPVKDKTHLQYNLVGSHINRYNSMISLAHFKGHAMGGFGGVLKNQSIGVASQNGKSYIHTAGYTTNPSQMWSHIDNQDGFLESMAAAAQAVHEYFKGNIVYINVMNNMSVDCDCDGNPAAPRLNHIGILASTDPVALDQACIDLVMNHPSTTGDDAAPLIERINSRHGTHTIDYAEQIGLGSKSYEITDLDVVSGTSNIEQESTLGHIYTLLGVEVKNPSKGIYIIDHHKVALK